MSKYLRDPEQNVKVYLPRFRVFFYLLGFFSALLFLRLFYLQIIQGKELREYSEKNSLKEIRISAPRGNILDRNEETLVQNKIIYQAVLYLAYTKDVKEDISFLSKVLNESEETLEKRIRRSQRRYGAFKPVVMKNFLNLEEILKIKKSYIKRPSVSVQEIIIRDYTLKENGAHIFGYLRKIRKRELEALREKLNLLKYDSDDLVGVYGIEKIYERYLRGVPGYSFIEVDVRGRQVSDRKGGKFFDLREIAPSAGNDLVLTIDKDIQKASYESFLKNSKTPEPMGAFVAMGKNGDILSLGSFPSFDPNKFNVEVSREFWSDLVKNPNNPLRNKVHQDHFSPGSVFKPIVALAALEKGKLDPEEKIHSPGNIAFKGRIYHDHQKQGHGSINLEEALERSSNVFFYKLGLRVGIDAIAHYAKDLGLGEKTALQLEGEVKGLVPSPSWKKKKYGIPWQEGETVSVSIGQSFVLLTLIQLTNLYNTIAQEGIKSVPYLIQKAVSPEGEVLYERTADDFFKPPSVIKRESFEIVKKGLWRVNNGKKGTARWWKVKGVEISGKTGTSQVKSFSSEEIYVKCENLPVKQRHHGWFVGYAPVENPEITVGVLTEHSCHGSTGSAPIVRDIIKSYFKKYKSQENARL